MKRIFLNLTSLLLVFSILFSFASCKKENLVEQVEEEVSTSRSTTQPVEIIEIPTDKEELTQMLNSAVEYIDVYCYHYTKIVDCKVSDVSVGSLSAASNSVDAFKSIFGEKNITMNYDYNASKDTFTANSPVGGYTIQEIDSISAEQVEDKIVITATFPNETNPNDTTGVLHRLCADYKNSDDIVSALKEFNSSAASVSVSASEITLKATIRAKDSGLEKLEVSYTQRFTLSGVVLSKLEGSTVTGTSATKVIYSDMGA